MAENIQLWFDNGDTSLSVRQFHIHEQLSGLFEVTVTALSDDFALDLSRFVGRPASCTLIWGSTRSWHGLCRAMRLVRAADDTQGLATYELTLVPELWRTTQRINCRLFQHRSIPAMIDRLLDDWGIRHRWEIDPGAYPALELRTQYQESDFHFMSRLLEEAGISYWFEVSRNVERTMTLVLSDAPEQGKKRAAGPLPFIDEPTPAQVAGITYATQLTWSEHSRPGRVTLRDYDFRRPRHPGFVTASAARTQEHAHEQYLFRPSSFRRELSPAEATAAGINRDAVGDDLGVARHLDRRGQDMAQIMLQALQSQRRRLTLECNAADVQPGVVLPISGHPHPQVSAPHGHLVLQSTLRGKVTDAATPWSNAVVAVSTDQPYRPAQQTPKPRINGVHTAVVVGPQPDAEETHDRDMLSAASRMPGAVGQLCATALDPAGAMTRLIDNDIYVDEHGRVRVQLPWDRENAFDSHSSIWMRISQGWAGGGYGALTIPRVGHEVLISFMDGDPDLPMIVGRVHNTAEPAHYALPANATVSSIKSASAPGGGGANELRFDDAAGREHLYVQAQRDMDTLVKHDSKEAVGGARSRYVQSHETVAVGRDRTQFVNFNEQAVTGLNAHRAVGVNRTSTIGSDDSTLVGARWSVMVARGLTGELPRQVERAAQSLGGVLRSAAGSVLGLLPNDPLGRVADATLSALGEQAWARLRDSVHMLDGFEADPGPPPTCIEMVDRQIKLSTGEASLILDGPNVTIMAQGGIALHAIDSVTVLSEKEVAIAGQDKVAMVSAGDDVIVQANRDLHLNPHAASSAAQRGLAMDPNVFGARLDEDPDSFESTDEDEPSAIFAQEPEPESQQAHEETNV